MARRSKYSPEFRERCVRVARESERSISEVARDLGIHPRTWSSAAGPRCSATRRSRRAARPADAPQSRTRVRRRVLSVPGECGTAHETAETAFGEKPHRAYTSTAFIRSSYEYTRILPTHQSPGSCPHPQWSTFRWTNTAFQPTARDRQRTGSSDAEVACGTFSGLVGRGRRDAAHWGRNGG